MKETTKKQKKLYIVLLVATIAAVILAVTLSLVFGLSGSKPDDGIIDPGSNFEDPGNNTEDPGNNTEDPGNNTEDPGNNTEDPGGETGGTPEIAYEMPMSSYEPGMQFEITQLVWSNTLKWFETHKGTDFIASKDTPVKAIFDGTVTDVGYNSSAGYFIVITQDDGIISTYKSLAANPNVEKGKTVKSGVTIGAVGDSMGSEQNEGYHLHLEMTKNGDLIDPMSKLAPGDK